MTTKTAEQGPRLPTYSAEVEARRAHYQREAEALITLLDLEQGQVHSPLDVEPDGVLTDEPEGHILWRAIQQHLSALFELVLRNHDDDFLRTFYVELRLYLDQARLQRAAADVPGGR